MIFPETWQRDVAFYKISWCNSHSFDPVFSNLVPRVSLLPAPWDGKKRDPGNEVVFSQGLFQFCNVRLHLFVFFFRRLFVIDS